MNNEEIAPDAAKAEKNDAPETAAKKQKNCCAVKTFVIALLTSVIAIAVYHCIMVCFAGCGSEADACRPPQPTLHIYHHFEEAQDGCPVKFRHHPAEHHFKGERRPDGFRNSKIRLNRKDKQQDPTPEQAD